MNSSLANGKRVSLLLVLTVGVVLRLALLPTTAGLNPRIVDEQHYHALATNLADGRGFAMGSGPTSLRPPLYPAFVAGIWRMTGTRSLQAVRVAQFGLAVWLTLAVFATTRTLFGENAALAAAAIATFYPALLVSNYLLLTEVLFATLVATAVWAGVHAFRSGAPGWAAAAGACIGLAALTRSVLYPLPVVVGALLLLAATRLTIGRRIVAAAVLVAAAAVVLAPWAIRNTRLQGVPVLVDTMGGMNLRMGNYEHTPHARIWDAVSLQGEASWIRGYPTEGAAWTEGQKERWARGQALRFMADHAGLTMWRSAIKFGDFWGLDRDFAAGVQQGLYHPPPWVTIVITGATLLAYPAVLFLAIIGVLRLGPPDWPAAWLPLVVVLFVCALHTVVFGHPRYRLPVMPLLAIYAGAALGAGRPTEAAGWRSLAAAVVATAFAALWIVQFVWRDWPAVERLLSVSR